ncbi:MAG: type II secretion system protein [Rickettsiales bacterium]
MKRRDRMHRNAFTLVELSIVLVIMGLIVGGIMAGASLIRNTEVKTAISQSQKYKNALYAFRSKYAGWPGDLSDATNYWGVKAGTGSDVTCHQTAGTGNATCNGNGDGFMEGISGDTSNGERFLTWQQMAAAGLIEGRFTGASTTAPTMNAAPGVNVPKPTVGGNNVRWEVHQLDGSVTGHAIWFDGSYPGNVMVLAGGPALKPEEAWNIDLKLDDGMPATGGIFVAKATSAWWPNCADGDTTAANYNLSDTAKRCPLYFGLQ